jgi:ABC-type glutathione transport system ATPase component
MMPPSEPALLSVRDLKITFDTEQGPVAAVENLSFDLRAGEVTGPEPSTRARTHERLAR